MNIVITGGSKGIGKAIAARYASANHNIFIGARNAADLEETASEIMQQYPGSKVAWQAADLSVRHEAYEFAAWVRRHGAADVVVNNAGTFLPGNIYDEPDGGLEAMIQTNLYSAYYITRALLPEMIEKRHGHIFNMCSVASLKAYPNGGSYSISKYALAGFSANLRHELLPFNIKVTAVYPGAVYTDSWSASGLPEDRFIRSEDIATLVYTTSLLSPAACVEDLIIRPQKGDI